MAPQACLAALLRTGSKHADWIRGRPSNAVATFVTVGAVVRARRRILCMAALVGDHACLGVYRRVRQPSEAFFQPQAGEATCHDALPVRQ